VARVAFADQLPARAVASLAAASLLAALPLLGCDRQREAKPEVAARSAALSGGAYWREVNVMPTQAGYDVNLAFDGMRGRLVLVQTESYRLPAVHTWEWDGQRWVDRNVRTRAHLRQTAGSTRASHRETAAWTGVRLRPTPVLTRA
jgi:hypothetical protein